MGIFERSMEIGHLFNVNGYNNSEETEDWTCSEECSTLANLAILTVDTTGVKTVDALATNVGVIIGNKVNIVDHSWDDYCRGFLAGQIIGEPTEENIKKAKEADSLWFNDDEGKYGYYHEVLEEVEVKS